MSEEKDKEKEGKNVVVSLGCSTIVLAIVLVFFPDTVPFDLFEFWFINIEVVALLKAMAPLFIWGLVLSLLSIMLNMGTPEWRRTPDLQPGNAADIWFAGIRVSLFAGIVEELVFRWFRFYMAMIFLQISNFLFFGWLGFGLAEFFAEAVFCPLADFFTLGFLNEYLFHPGGWFVGAALLASNGNFRDGHGYQGVTGWVNSWFCGMVFFYITFQYGLFAAMIVHFFYDFFLFTLLAGIVALKGK